MLNSVRRTSTSHRLLILTDDGAARDVCQDVEADRPFAYHVYQSIIARLTTFHPKPECGSGVIQWLQRAHHSKQQLITSLPDVVRSWDRIVVQQSLGVVIYDSGHVIDSTCNEKV